MAKLIHPELSYKIVGILFEVDNQIGYGHRENLYQAAISSNLKDKNINLKKYWFLSRFMIYYRHDNFREKLHLWQQIIQKDY